jgi:hypothetical protein
LSGLNYYRFPEVVPFMQVCIALCLLIFPFVMRIYKIKNLLGGLSLVSLVAYGSVKNEVYPNVSSPRTPKTEKLLANLKSIPSKGLMFGHHVPDYPYLGFSF